MQMKRKLHRYEINRPSSRNKHKYSKYKNIVNIKSVSVFQFMKELSNIEAELKKELLLKKTCNLVFSLLHWLELSYRFHSQLLLFVTVQEKERN